MADVFIINIERVAHRLDGIASVGGVRLTAGKKTVFGLAVGAAVGVVGAASGLGAWLADGVGANAGPGTIDSPADERVPGVLDVVAPLPAVAAADMLGSTRGTADASA